ncbi:10458_t:CDS:2 [Ambispora gerdemannii]|uniref:10458_t:CDS:1 n=1 Tax=Ambispora gerdemannii TaxID=144530 RepID=A0A9N9FIL6_9GLOM|nr:10458_t:CDS:2 [Ambispora gerdemannii]
MSRTLSTKLVSVVVIVFSFYASFLDAFPWTPKFNKLLVFSDSYGDDGNVYRLSNGTWPPSFYYKGGFSNGPLWTAHLSQRLSAQLENYAYGGYSGADGNLKVPGIKQQVNTFTAKVSNQTDLSHTLAVFWPIGNDYVFTNYTAAPSDVVTRLASAWTLVYAKGVRHFLIPNLFDISLLPIFKGSAPSFLALLKDIYQKNNKELKKAIKTFEASHPDVRVYAFQADQFWVYYRKVQASRLGITNFEDGCASTYESKPLTICSNPDSYFYWDGFHPSAKVHQAIAAGFYASLG